MGARRTRIARGDRLWHIEECLFEFGWGIGAGNVVDPVLEVSPLPGTGAWTKPGTPAAMTQGPAQAAVTNDGKNNIILTASYNAGMWRYVEP